MTIKKVPVYLKREAQIAINNNQYRYDRVERYALHRVLLAANTDKAIDDVFIKCALNGLRNYPVVNKPQIAA